ncbi:uncharacterized protein F4807DRAFT_296579 [Annulohypoxylon truncatum]|uniref:uncharacterized protein n=1 Tax=Annulohypoxylon truncatum TaxID=327061 RepID=UPI002008059C|nr:uncharacterized protein F4807DRAFT_296579 [Annulohypoxylon truncatum]KAI1204980.1 hypothetical protein F4807DRAFT_296579 [Annulohypoxylon truncatum]
MPDNADVRVLDDSDIVIRTREKRAQLQKELDETSKELEKLEMEGPSDIERPVEIRKRKREQETELTSKNPRLSGDQGTQSQPSLTPNNNTIASIPETTISLTPSHDNHIPFSDSHVLLREALASWGHQISRLTDMRRSIRDACFSIFQYYGDLDGRADKTGSHSLDDMNVEQLRLIKDKRPAGHVSYSIYLKTDALEDLNEAYGEAEERMPDANDPYYMARLNDQIVLLTRRFLHTRSINDIEGAINRTQEMVSLTSLDHPQRDPQIRDCLTMWCMKYDCTHSQDDLDDASSFMQQATGGEPTIGPTMVTPACVPGQLAATLEPAPRPTNEYKRTNNLNEGISSSIPQARVVNFSFCHDRDCRFGHQLHLLVRRKLVDLKPGNATAISYTWGEFNRTSQKIGHFEDGSDTVMTLGEEWVSGTGYHDLITTLRDICCVSLPDTSLRANEFCWIDQLSIQQDDDEDVRESLAKIPDIYRTYSVLVLLPGALCECIEEGWKSLQRDDTYGNSSPRFNPDKIGSGGKKMSCWNNMGYANWFQRVWTRQELLYARNIKVRWTSPKPLSCPGKRMAASDDDDIIDALRPNLNITAKLRYNSSLKLADKAERGYTKGGCPISTKFRLDQEATDSYKESCLCLLTWLHIHTIREEQIWGVFTRFLCGEELVDTSKSNSDMTEEQKLRRFFLLLNTIMANNRNTTDERDLVVAVWVDCPRYALPLNYKQMGLYELMEDAVCQLENKWGISLVTTAPAGLFSDPAKPSDGSSPSSFLWRPTHYMPTTNNSRINNTKKAYANLICSSDPYKVDSSRQLSLKMNSSINNLNPLSCSHPMDFKTTFGDISTADVIQFTSTVCQHWGSGPLQLLLLMLPQGVGIRNAAPGFYKFIISLISMLPTIPEDITNSIGMVAKGWGELPSISLDTEFFLQELTRDRAEDHHDILYQIICEVCGLDMDLCQQKGLRLVVDFGSEGMPPRLGLSSIHYQDQTNISTFTVCIDPPGGQRFMCPREVMFEILIRDAPSEDKQECFDYQVVGIWVQPTTYAEDGIHGRLPTVSIM